MYTTIISASELFAQLDNPKWIIFDCRFNVTQPQWGREQYDTGHIPGAFYCDLDKDLSSPPTSDSGRHPLPDAQTLGLKLAAWGVSDNSQVVVYDEAVGAVAARMWWTLRWLGHNAVAVLDGGLKQWNEAAYPLNTELPKTKPKGNFQPHPNDDLWVSTAEVERVGTDADTVLIDARSQARFRGEEEQVDPIGGHIPGALNRPLTDNMGSDGRFLSSQQLRDYYAPLCREQVIHYCGSGVTACHNLLAMEVAGLGLQQLYVGSWSEWIRSKDRPLATGD
ncbi:MAG: sulfurtransferase [Gammaproteobacteria bacterium]|nr:sulfurtransferase [Gammaproteobacteria bacterium]